jgi:hypothetical protein
MSIHSPGYQQALIIERDPKVTPPLPCRERSRAVSGVDAACVPTGGRTGITGKTVLAVTSRLDPA